MPNRAPPPKCPPNRLTEIMREYGMSPYKIRDRLRDDYEMDVSASTFYELAKGPAQLTHYYMVLLAEIIGCDACDFMPEAPPPLSIRERVMLTAFRQLTEAVQDQAIRIIQTFPTSAAKAPKPEAAETGTTGAAVVPLPIKPRRPARKTKPKVKDKLRVKKGAK